MNIVECWMNDRQQSTSLAAVEQRLHARIISSKSSLSARKYFGACMKVDDRRFGRLIA